MTTAMEAATATARETGEDASDMRMLALCACTRQEPGRRCERRS